jgi:hypothetical protein
MITPKIDYKIMETEYIEFRKGTAKKFRELWEKYQLQIRIVHGWLLAYEDVFNWLEEELGISKPIYIYPAMQKGACFKNRNIFIGIERDYNHDLDFGIVVHEIIHVAFGMDQKQEKETEIYTKKLVKEINQSFKTNIVHD